MKNLNSCVWASLFALLGACSPSAEDATAPAGTPAAAPAPADPVPVSLARVQVSDDDVINFYELSPGHVILSESFPQSSPPPSRRDLVRMSPVQAFLTLSPGSSVPDALARAQQRIDALHAAAAGQQRQRTPGTGGALAPSPRSVPAPVTPQGGGCRYSGSYFYSWAPGCPDHYDENYYNWCKIDTNGTWNYYASDADADYGVLCTDCGSALLQINGLPTIVSAGYCLGHEEFVSTDPFDLGDYYINYYATAIGSGSFYHFAGYLEW